MKKTLSIASVLLAAAVTATISPPEARASRTEMDLYLTSLRWSAGLAFSFIS